MRTPIIVYENGDVSLFASREAAETALEPIDVKNDEYSIYAADGTIIKQRVSKRYEGGRDIEIIELIESANGRISETELRDLLVDFLIRADLKNEQELKTYDLKSVLDLFVKEVGYVK